MRRVTLLIIALALFAQQAMAQVVVTRAQPEAVRAVFQLTSAAPTQTFPIDGSGASLHAVTCSPSNTSFTLTVYGSTDGGTYASQGTTTTCADAVTFTGTFTAIRVTVATLTISSSPMNVTYSGNTSVAHSGGNGDVVGPSGAIDGHLAVYDGVTGLLIKDGGAVPAGTFTGTVSSGCVVIGTGTDVLGCDSDLTFSGATLTATNLAVTSTSTFSDNVTIANGKYITGDTTDAHTWSLRARDVDGTSDTAMLTFTNANSPVMNVTAPTGMQWNSLGTQFGFTNANGTGNGPAAYLGYISATDNSFIMGKKFTSASSWSGLQFLIGGTNNYIISTQDGLSDSGELNIRATQINLRGKVVAESLSTASGTPNSICQNDSTKEITVNAALTCTVSARDQKNSIAPLALSATGLIRSLQPVSFKYNDRDRVRYGFIAEDVAAVDPRFGDAWIGDDARSLDLPALLAVSVKAVQELEERVRALEAR